MFAVLIARPLSAEAWNKRSDGFHVYAVYFREEGSWTHWWGKSQWWMLKKGRVFDSAEQAFRYMRQWAKHASKKMFDGGVVVVNGAVTDVKWLELGR